MHIRQSDGGIFYMGIGCRDRAFDISSRSEWWKSTYNLYGRGVVILQENLTWEQACDLEKKMIAFYGRRDKGLGPLVNMTDGGEGTPGAVRSEEFKQSVGDRFRKDQNDFIQQSVEKHGEGRFDYQFVDYKGQYDLVRLVCSKHGDIFISPKQHLGQHGCNECGMDAKKEKLKQPKTKEHCNKLSISKMGKCYQTDEQKQKQSENTKGSKNPNSKLTEDDVRYIRTHYKPYSKEFGMKQLANMFGVSVPTIDLITRNRIWTEVV